jgi:hypothetical protein
MYHRLGMAETMRSLRLPGYHANFSKQRSIAPSDEQDIAIGSLPNGTPFHVVCTAMRDIPPVVIRIADGRLERKSG